MYDDGETLEEQVGDIQYSDCCGIILLGTEMSAEDFRIFKAVPLPIVLLDTYFETVQTNYVLINNVQGAYLSLQIHRP